MTFWATKVENSSMTPAEAQMAAAATIRSKVLIQDEEIPSSTEARTGSSNTSRSSIINNSTRATTDTTSTMKRLANLNAKQENSSESSKENRKNITSRCWGRNGGGRIMVESRMAIPGIRLIFMSLWRSEIWLRGSPGYFCCRIALCSLCAQPLEGQQGESVTWMTTYASSEKWNFMREQLLNPKCTWHCLVKWANRCQEHQFRAARGPCLVTHTKIRWPATKISRCQDILRMEGFRDNDDNNMRFIID